MKNRQDAGSGTQDDSESLHVGSPYLKSEISDLKFEN